MKTCNTCHIDKPETEFHRRKVSGTQYRCKACQKLANAAYTALKGPELQKKRRIRWGRLRLEAILKRGGCCEKCGFSDVRALQFDHVNGGGHQERLAEGSACTYKIAQRILQGDNRYQVLCANCNWIKRYENGEHGGTAPFYADVIGVSVD